MDRSEFRFDGVVGFRTGTRLPATERPVRRRTSWSLQDGDRRPVRKPCAARRWDYSDDPTMRYEFGELSLDTEALQLRRGETPIHLSPKAMELLIILIVERHRAMPKKELYDRLWQETFV